MYVCNLAESLLPNSAINLADDLSVKFPDKAPQIKTCRSDRNKAPLIMRTQWNDWSNLTVDIPELIREKYRFFRDKLYSNRRKTLPAFHAEIYFHTVIHDDFENTVGYEVRHSWRLCHGNHDMESYGMSSLAGKRSDVSRSSSFSVSHNKHCAGLTRKLYVTLGRNSLTWCSKWNFGALFPLQT